MSAIQFDEFYSKWETLLSEKIQYNITAASRPGLSTSAASDYVIQAQYFESALTRVQERRRLHLKVCVKVVSDLPPLFS